MSYVPRRTLVLPVAWKNTLMRNVVLKKILLTLAVLSIADLGIGMSAGLFHGIGFFPEKSECRLASDLAFVEGATILFIGSIMAFHSRNVKLREIAVTTVGAIMIGLAVVFGIFA